MGKLSDALVDTGEGFVLPASRVAEFTLMDSWGNMLESKRQRGSLSRWRVPKSELGPWLRLVDSMQESPRGFGGRRAA